LQNEESELMPEVSVNGKVLRWARELRGLTLEEGAKLLGISAEELSVFEVGGKKPMVEFLRAMSSKYRINFTSLLMPEPPPLRKRPTDHRARNSKRRLSMDTLVAIEEVSEALEAFRDIARVKRSIVTKPRLGLADIDENPEEVAARERKKFDVSLEVQRSWKHLAKARIEWRKRIEQRGIFTYMIGLPLEELSGFFLLQDGFAAICVNDRELTEGAKICNASPPVRLTSRRSNVRGS
jgi:transcriptional regulator with XRE-family HTH domain